MVIRKPLIAALFILVFLVTFTLRIHAKEFEGKNVSEIDVPDSFEVVFSEHCSGHQNFKQVSPREDGSFAIYAHNTNFDETPELVFKRQYIDVFDPEGNFLYEMSFTSSQHSAIKYTSDSIIVYFYRNILLCDLDTRELTYFAIPEEEMFSSQHFIDLLADEVYSGKWLYKCKTTLDCYTKLTRSDGNYTETLLSYPGTRINLFRLGLPPIILAVTVFFIWKKRKKRSPSAG